jgi:hypothetical protein
MLAPAQTFVPYHLTEAVAHTGRRTGRPVGCICGLGGSGLRGRVVGPFRLGGRPPRLAQLKLRLRVI